MLKILKIPLNMLAETSVLPTQVAISCKQIECIFQNFTLLPFRIQKV